MTLCNGDNINQLCKIGSYLFLIRCPGCCQLHKMMACISEYLQSRWQTGLTLILYAIFYDTPMGISE